MTADTSGLGAGFRGVGSSGYEQNPAAAPVKLANGNIKVGKKIFTPSDPEYFGYAAMLLGTGNGGDVNAADANKFRGGLLSGDPNALRIRELMVRNGIVSANAGLNTIVSAYQDKLENLAALKSVGQVFTLEQLIQQEGAFNALLPGAGGGAGGPSVSVSEVDYGKASVGDKSQGARQARKQIQEFFRESIGRAGTTEEVEQMRVALVKASAKAKPVTTTVREGNRTITRTTPGFDLQSWATGYISTKFADEDIDGALGQAQDQLKSLARAYGVDMGDSWYAAAIKQIARGAAVKDFQDEVKQVAIGRYPGLADRFAKGSSTIQIASPYIQSKAKLLEMDPDSIDLDDMDIQQAIGYKDTNGAYGTKPIWQFEQDLRKKPEWQYTKNAKDSYDTLMLKVLRDFGLMG